MSLKKDKYLESAQKFIIKGQFDKAAADLEQAVALDPGDLKVRQRLAETLVRINRQKDAVSHYETIGKSFANSGFYLKAIAVYKQVQKLDPNNTSITITLAELNVNHGLVGNALAEFSQVVNLYLKAGKQKEALELLERMREVDPSNLNTLLKIAETMLAAGSIDDAYERYRQLAQLLWERPDKTPFTRLCDRIKTLFPDKGCSILSFLAVQLEQGDTATVFEQLKQIIAQSPDNLDAWYLMTDTIRAMGDTTQLRLLLARISQRFPAEVRSREEEIELAISFHETDKTLKLLDDYRVQLLGKNRSAQLEKFYNELHLLAPDDARPLDGLCWLYGETGDLEKLAAIQNRLSPPSIEQEFEELEPLSVEEPEEVPVLPTPTVPDLSDLTHEPEIVPGSKLKEFDTPEWEEDVELDLEEGLEEQPGQLPQIDEIAETVPFTEAEPEILEELTLAEEDLLATDTETAEEIFPGIDAIDIQEETVVEGEDDFIPPEQSDRVILTIESPLPVEAFLQESLVSTGIASVPEPEQISPWDEISQEETSIGTHPTASESQSVPPAEELMDLLVGHIDSFDWEGTDNRITGLGYNQGTDELQVEIVADSDESADTVSEIPFELDDLESFTDALFTGEPSLEALAPESEEYSLNSLISAFKKGVEEQLEESDTESHFNLGIAYKEMGLYDEAIHEFRSACHDPQRAADCIALQGICYREKGDLDAAESIFREGLALTNLSTEVLLNLKYELAQLLENAARPQEALAIYREIIKTNHSYRDVSLKVSHLSGDDDLDILDRELIELDVEGD